MKRWLPSLIKSHLPLILSFLVRILIPIRLLEFLGAELFGQFAPLYSILGFTVLFDFGLFFSFFVHLRNKIDRKLPFHLLDYKDLISFSRWTIIASIILALIGFSIELGAIISGFALLSLIQHYFNQLSFQLRVIDKIEASLTYTTIFQICLISALYLFNPIVFLSTGIIIGIVISIYIHKKHFSSITREQKKESDFKNNFNIMNIHFLNSVLNTLLSTFLILVYSISDSDKLEVSQILFHRLPFVSAIILIDNFTNIFWAQIQSKSGALKNRFKLISVFFLSNISFFSLILILLSFKGEEVMQILTKGEIHYNPDSMFLSGIYMLSYSWFSYSSRLRQIQELGKNLVLIGIVLISAGYLFSYFNLFQVNSIIYGLSSFLVILSFINAKNYFNINH